MKSGARAHLLAFVAFVQSKGLTVALRRIDGVPRNSEAFAAGYNGTGHATPGYHTKIAAAFVEWSRA